MTNGTNVEVMDVCPPHGHDRVSLGRALRELLPELPEAEKAAAELLLAWLGRGSSLDPAGDPDPMFDNAVTLVMATRRCSAPWLQRKFGVCPARAARLAEELEAHGVVGPVNDDHEEERQVLVGREPRSDDVAQEGR